MAGTTEKVAISLDSELLRRIERLRAATGESRSAIIRRALALLTREEARAAEIRRYQEAYRETPEAQPYVDAARRLAHRSLSLLDWDET